MNSLVTKRSKYSFIVSFLLFVTLAAWSVSSPIGSGVDADFHLGSIWCARGETKDLCESVDLAANTATVPFMFQMCDGRNIYFWPKCEIASENNPTQSIRIANDKQQSVYYWTTHLFSSKNVNSSVLLIRLFNSLLASLVFFALLALSSDQLRKAIVISWTLTLIPNGIQLLSGINPRSWAVLGIMSSWAFLQAFLTENPHNRHKRYWQLGLYLCSIALTASARFDSLLFVCFVSAVILVSHFVDFESHLFKRTVGIAGISVLAILALRSNPRMNDILSFSVPSTFSAPQYFLFELIHIPEFVANWWGFSASQQENVPGIIGLVGVSLFAVFMYEMLRGADRRQVLAVSTLTMFTLLALFRATSSIGALIPLTGVYTFGLVAPIIGVAVVHSKNTVNRLTSSKMRSLVVSWVGSIHLLAFYGWIEFCTRRGVNTQFFDTFSLTGTWWWNSSFSPNVIFGMGSLAFFAFLLFAWKSLEINSLDAPEYL